METERQVLPYTDAELEAIYEKVAPPTSELQFAPGGWVPATIGVVTAAFSLFVAVTKGDAGGGPFIFVAITFLCLGVGLTLQLLRPGKESFNPSNPAHLDRVVEWVLKMPIAGSEDLQAQIRVDLWKLQSALQALDTLLEGIRKEKRDSEDASLGDLLDQQLASALNAKETLQRQHEILTAQLHEAIEAVAPLHSLKERFERVRALGSALEKIQAAHAIADATEERISMHQASLAALRSATSLAEERLNEVRNRLAALEGARSELGPLQIAVPAPKELEEPTERVST